MATARGARCGRHALCAGQQLTRYCKNGAQHQRAASQTSIDKRPTSSNPFARQLDFNDTKSVFQDRATAELLRSYVVFNLCTIKALVKNSNALVKLSNRVLGKQLTAWGLKQTFFAQFVAGEDATTIKPTLARLRAAGVGGILDYAAESDVGEHQLEGKVTAGPRVFPAGVDPIARAGSRSFSTPAAPLPSLPGEAELEGNLRETLSGLATAKEEGGFAAVKVTALARPELLQRVSEVLDGQRRVFRALASASASPTSSHSVYTSRLSPTDFDRGLHTLRSKYGASLPPGLDTGRLFAMLDVTCDGVIDYLDWMDACSLSQGLPLGILGVSGGGDAAHVAGTAAGAAGLHSAQQLLQVLGVLLPSFRPELARGLAADSAALSALEKAEWAAVVRRADILASTARGMGVTVMIDAEQTYLQPAIEAVGTSAMRKYNRPHPASWSLPEVTHVMRLTSSGSAPTGPYNSQVTDAVKNNRHTPDADAACYPAVYNTFQAYLRDCPARVSLFCDRSVRDRFLFGAKLVRGAYMIQERERAGQMGYHDPVHPDLASTHACFHACADSVLTSVVSTRGGELMVASHNEASIMYIVQRMGVLGLDPRTCGVSFGQLLGMCDHVTLSLGRAGYAAYKYVPYGPVHGVIPYLLRRAQENSDLMSGGVGKELRLLSAELKRRAGMGA